MYTFMLSLFIQSIGMILCVLLRPSEDLVFPQVCVFVISCRCSS
ncbi:hypothetical protein M6B38_340355 [Iris pallida]|uniref:Uncharacterized protein n=1 Tax=Iris pallida TaxID=29817 RepID=A0AAX6GXW7_IRIPA|nr:hypothetical protein M6B38_340355 [Iris pallida]